MSVNHARFPHPLLPLFVYGSLRPGMALWRVIVDEELRYGYDARWLPVALDDGTSSEAIVLVWPHAAEVGARIDGGDYAAVAER